jgi:hypothetical protein
MKKEITMLVSEMANWQGRDSTLETTVTFSPYYPHSQDITDLRLLAVDDKDFSSKLWGAKVNLKKVKITIEIQD